MRTVVRGFAYSLELRRHRLLDFARLLEVVLYACSLLTLSKHLKYLHSLRIDDSTEVSLLRYHDIASPWPSYPLPCICVPFFVFGWSASAALWHSSESTSFLIDTLILAWYIPYRWSIGIPIRIGKTNHASNQGFTYRSVPLYRHFVGTGMVMV
ncbi:hypothetical protein B296_00025075 [Ensete ventricosum]|uniref:Uncharacterized protein n=1 Tax=Ensete ventricosum TaxID=4639 RepID=A0A427AED3_ENSVE|nr:hypothetical protein B296_00025075 [Ensete ventricosum]